MPQLNAFAVPGLPEIRAGDDLGALIVGACRAAGIALEAGDVLVVASKVVAKSEGRSVVATFRDAAVRAETVREVASRRMPDGELMRVVQSRSGPVLAAAGVDASDVAEGTVLLLPADPDASARSLRARIESLAGVRPGVLITDTSGRPWRAGVSDFALGVAGLVVLDDLRGRQDRFGRTLESTVRAVGDEVAAFADLVKGKSAGTPIAVVRGLGRFVTEGDGLGAATCVRIGATDWFAYGWVEAVRAALGVRPGEVAAPLVDSSSESVDDRVARAMTIASMRDLPEVGLTVEADRVVLSGAPLHVGILAERLRVALWAEGLDGRLHLGPGDVSVCVSGPHPAPA